jgi:LAGLIDADG DNA endonuclease family
VLLGDATLLKTTSGHCFRVHHGRRQQCLVDWKYAELARFVRTAPKLSGNRYYFRTITHPELAELREQFYTAG